MSTRYDEIHTERLALRQWAAGDREPFATLNADPVVMEHFPAPLTREQSDAFLNRIEAHFQTHGYGLWAVERAGKLLGLTGLNWAEGLEFSPALEVGWRFTPPAWGHGYATEAARAALEVGLEQADSVVSFTAIVNERSWRVMERLGMVRESVFDHPRVPDGSPLKRHYLYRTS